MPKLKLKRKVRIPQPENLTDLLDEVRDIERSLLEMRHSPDHSYWTVLLGQSPQLLRIKSVVVRDKDLTVGLRRAINLLKSRIKQREDYLATGRPLPEAWL